MECHRRLRVRMDISPTAKVDSLFRPEPTMGLPPAGTHPAGLPGQAPYPQPGYQPYPPQPYPYPVPTPHQQPGPAPDEGSESKG